MVLTLVIIVSVSLAAKKKQKKKNQHIAMISEASFKPENSALPSQE